jgi:hypothetical protein
VTGTPSGDNAVVRGRNVTDIEIPYLRVTGGPWFGVFVRNGSNVHLGQIELRLSGGLGIRIDNHRRSNRANKVRKAVFASSNAVYGYGPGPWSFGRGLVGGVGLMGNGGCVLNAATGAGSSPAMSTGDRRRVHPRQHLVATDVLPNCCDDRGTVDRDRNRARLRARPRH